MVNAELLSEVLQRVDDIGFKDFNKGIYLNSIFRANRLVARKYHLFRKVMVFTLGNQTQDLSKDIILDIPDMKEAILVNVNGINLNKKDFQLITGAESYSYYLTRTPDGQYLFNYLLGNPVEQGLLIQSPDITEGMSEQTVFTKDADVDSAGKAVTDEITIVYEALPERDYEESEFVIPQNYEEEQIELTVFHLAKLGIAKFKEGKLDKYSRLYRLYKKNSDLDKEVVETSEPTRIQPFQYP